jgi:hypothetical protein
MATLVAYSCNGLRCAASLSQFTQDTYKVFTTFGR